MAFSLISIHRSADTVLQAAPLGAHQALLHSAPMILLATQVYTRKAMKWGRDENARLLSDSA